MNRTAAHARGNERIAALSEAFPTIPRSIVIKSDILREGIRHTPDLEEAGASSFPHSLIWNPKHAWNPQGGTNGNQLLTVPWKFDLPDGTPVVVRFSDHGPYEIRKANGGYALCRDGEVVETASFEPKTDWLFKTTSSGALMASVLLSWTREALLGCALRYCEYAKTGEQCTYCCLDGSLAEYRRAGIEYDLVVKPESAAETYRAAYEEVGRIRNLDFTGGSLVNTAKESERYVTLYSALNRVRDELGAQTEFSACITPPPNLDTIRRLKDAGIDFIGPNMDCWEESLWPVIVPGKHRYVGRQAWMDSILSCLEVFGDGHVYTVFVVGPEMVPKWGFKSQAQGVESWRQCFEWFLSHGIVPDTSQWQVEVGSPWEHEQPPPTEYFLEVGLMRHQLMQQCGGYEMMRHWYYKMGAWTTDADYRRLMLSCSCDNCR
jgi:hypothetical protein